MDLKDRINNYVMQYQKFFTGDKVIILREQLEELDEKKLNLVMATELKDPTTLIIVSILVGYFGIDRFMLGETGIGVAKLLTGGGCGIWWLVDLFLITDKTKEYNYQKIDSSIRNIK
ncbi:MAG: TM2 domain-containing protein [Elusimicrobiota bacterium]|jgi:TM2 domain-containing membrane protein YozV|nr:TM2 domain-containing protein [Elusimicrobiota bacterium]